MEYSVLRIGTAQVPSTLLTAHITKVRVLEERPLL